MSHHLRRTTLDRVIADVILLVRGDAAIRGVRIVTELDSRVPSVHADLVQLQQVLLNLLLNGAEAMTSCHPEDRTLVVRTAQHSAKSVVVHVQDCGIGVMEEDMEQLFSPFYTTKPGGMGMGLSVARSIVVAHGGRLWATTNPNRGATFSFTLLVAEGTR